MVFSKDFAIALIWRCWFSIFFFPFSFVPGRKEWGLVKVGRTGGIGLRFWEDKWVGSAALRLSFLSLFRVAASPVVRLFECFERSNAEIVNSLILLLYCLFWIPMALPCLILILTLTSGCGAKMVFSL